jgi:hypothetical protein
MLQQLLTDLDPSDQYHSRDVLRCAAPVGVFWLCTQIGQRLCGAARMQYGRRGAGVAGFLVVLGGVTTTQFVQSTAVDPAVLKNTVVRKPFSWQKYITCTSLSLISFVALGLKPFSAVLPSSVIQLGSFKKIPHFPIPGAKGSVPVAHETANSAQRTRIQRLGKLYGCHQCGSKQLLGFGNFISDHMPPTAHVKIANQIWWRRLTGIEV